MHKKKIIITGSSGMLGSVLCNSLNRDYQVFGIDLENRNRFNNFLKCDITKPHVVRKIFLNILPDIVIHTAAYTDVDGCEINKQKAKNINTQGSVNITKACRHFGCVLFFISTDYVFSGRKKGPYSEKDRPFPSNVYGRTKLDAERFIQKTSDKYFIIRTSWLYGTGGKNFVNTIIDISKEKSLLKVVDDQIGGPTYVIDLTKALKVLIKKVGSFPKKYSGIYNITNSGRCSWYELTKEIAKSNGLQVQIIPIRSRCLKRVAKRPKNSLLDNSKFNRLTHEPMRNWEEALREYIKKNR